MLTIDNQDTLALLVTNLERVLGVIIKIDFGDDELMLLPIFHNLDVVAGFDLLVVLEPDDIVKCPW